MMKIVYMILGSISLVLGTIGIFLPLLPTTPFYLLTAWLYMRSSPKLYSRVMNNKYFGTIVRDFQVEKSISLKTKIITVSILWITILLSAFLAVSLWWVRLLLFAIATGVTIHVLSYRTKKMKWWLMIAQKTYNKINHIKFLKQWKPEHFNFSRFYYLSD